MRTVTPAGDRSRIIERFNTMLELQGGPGIERHPRDQLRRSGRAAALATPGNELAIPIWASRVASASPGLLPITGDGTGGPCRVATNVRGEALLTHDSLAVRQTPTHMPRPV